MGSLYQLIMSSEPPQHQSNKYEPQRCESKECLGDTNHSDGFILDGGSGVDGAFFVEDTISAISAFDGVVRLQLRLLAAL